MSNIPVIQYETRVVTYTSDKAMQRGIDKMQRQGWEVVSVETIERGWAKGKTCCLGVLFLPLALFGKKPAVKQVVFRRPKK